MPDCCVAVGFDEVRIQKLWIERTKIDRGTRRQGGQRLRAIGALRVPPLGERPLLWALFTRGVLAS
jgi:hypothetical protein